MRSGLVLHRSHNSVRPQLVRCSYQRKFVYIMFLCLCCQTAAGTLTATEMKAVRSRRYWLQTEITWLSYWFSWLYLDILTFTFYFLPLMTQMHIDWSTSQTNETGNVLWYNMKVETKQLPFVSQTGVHMFRQESPRGLRGKTVDC